jgi:hypothetical protein
LYQTFDARKLVFAYFPGCDLSPEIKCQKLRPMWIILCPLRAKKLTYPIVRLFVSYVVYFLHNIYSREGQTDGHWYGITTAMPVTTGLLNTACCDRPNVACATYFELIGWITFNWVTTGKRSLDMFNIVIGQSRVVSCRRLSS